MIERTIIQNNIIQTEKEGKMEIRKKIMVALVLIIAVSFFGVSIGTDCSICCAIGSGVDLLFRNHIDSVERAISEMLAATNIQVLEACLVGGTTFLLIDSII